MANTPIEFRTNQPIDGDFSAKLVAADDTLRQTFTSVDVTSLTNGGGRHQVTYTGSATGHHTLTIFQAGVATFVEDYNLADTTDLHFPIRISTVFPNNLADAILDRASAIDGKTVREALRYIAAVIAGRISGAGTGTETFVGLDESTDRVTVTVDGSGNRTDIEYDP